MRPAADTGSTPDVAVGEDNQVNWERKPRARVLRQVEYQPAHFPRDGLPLMLWRQPAAPCVKLPITIRPPTSAVLARRPAARPSYREPYAIPLTQESSDSEDSKSDLRDNDDYSDSDGNSDIVNTVTAQIHVGLSLGQSEPASYSCHMESSFAVSVNPRRSRTC